MRSAVITIAGAWLALVVVTWALQERMIYLPDRSTPVLPAAFEPVLLRTADGLTLDASFLAHTDPASIVVVAPGNAGHRGHRVLLAEALHRRGHAVLLVDYRGYGGNPGRPTEDGVVADLRAALHWVRGRDETDPDRVVLLGESIGSAVAAAVAVDDPPAALVLRSAFPGLADVARRHYPFLPVRALLREQHPTSAYLGRFDGPVLVVAGESDRIVPAGLSARVAADAGATLVSIAGAGHNDRALLDGEVFIDAIDDFVRSHVAAG